MKTSVQRTRATTQTGGETIAKSVSGAKQKTELKSSPIISTPRSASSQSASKVAAKSGASGKLSAKETGAETVAKKITESNKLASDQPAALRATKKRAPKDLAIQYGESVKTPRAIAPKAAPRKRRNAQSRAKLQAVITPDDDLMQRLAKAGAISSAQMAQDSGKLSIKPLSTRRSRKWEALCGKCGASAQYSASAALCVKCGAILVRDMG